MASVPENQGLCNPFHAPSDIFSCATTGRRSLACRLRGVLTAITGKMAPEGKFGAYMVWRRRRRARVRRFRIVALALIGEFAYILQGLDGDQAAVVMALPAIGILTLVLLGTA